MVSRAQMRQQVSASIKGMTNKKEKIKKTLTPVKPLQWPSAYASGALSSAAGQKLGKLY